MPLPASKPSDTGTEQQIPQSEHRAALRHKIHSPAYTTTDQNSSYILPDLNEIVDLSEDGMCFQNLAEANVGEQMELALDLSETKAYIRAEGKVIWSEPSGRTGIHFLKMPEESHRQIKEWLFVNAIIAYMNYSNSPADSEAGGPAESDVALLPDHTSILAAVAAISREAAALAPNVDAALQLIAERAQTLTRATGAAIALSSAESMVCRASAGSDAPGIGSTLEVGSGFSGECVSTGQLLYCEDTEHDSRVDREICRALGLRSMVAVPVHSADKVIGLLEVFSTQANNFTESDKVALQQLAEIASHSIKQAADAASPPSPTATELASWSALPEESESPKSSLLRRLLLIAIIAAAVVLLGLIVIPRVRGKMTQDPNAAPVQSQAAPVPQPEVATGSVEELRRLADKGDAAAQFSLGVRCATGEEVPQDYAQAARWFGLAADRGHVGAQSIMAAYYQAGTGVQKDLPTAYFWAILAQAGGDKASKLYATDLASRISRREIIAAQQQAGEWLKQHQLSSTAASSTQ